MALKKLSEQEIEKRNLRRAVGGPPRAIVPPQHQTPQPLSRQQVRDVPTGLPGAGALPIVGGAVGALAGGAVGGPPGAIAGGVIGSGLGETGRQQIRKEPLSPSKIALESALGALGGLGGAGTRLVGRATTRAAAKPLGLGVEVATGVPRGAGERIVRRFGKLPELSAKKVRQFSQKLIEGAKEIQNKASKNFKNAILSETKRVGKDGIVPKSVIDGILNQVEQRLASGVPGQLPAGTDRAIRKIRLLKRQVDTAFKNRTTIDPDNLVKLRQNIDRTIKEAGTEGIDLSVLSEARQGVNRVIEGFHPAIRRADAEQVAKINILDDLKDTFGLDPSEIRLSVKSLEKVEKKVKEALTGTETFKEATRKIDDAFDTVTGLIDDLQDLSTAQAFRKNTSGLARIGLLGQLLPAAAGAFGFAGGGTPGAILAPAALLAATSPRAVAAGIRGVTGLGAVGAETLGQVGARKAPELLQGLRQQVSDLEPVPGTTMLRSLKQNLLITPPSNEPQPELGDIFLRTPPPRRSRVIERR